MNVSMIFNKNSFAVLIPHSTNSWDPAQQSATSKVRPNMKHVKTEFSYRNIRYRQTRRCKHPHTSRRLQGTAAHLSPLDYFRAMLTWPDSVNMEGVSGHGSPDVTENRVTNDLLKTWMGGSTVSNEGRRSTKCWKRRKMEKARVGWWPAKKGTQRR